MSIIRFQIDTAMTIFARTLVGDMSDFANHLCEGNERRKYRDRSGEKLFDLYLHKKLTTRYEFISDIYGKTSGNIQFTHTHMCAVVDLDKFKIDGTLEYKNIEDMPSYWNDEEIKGACVTFLWATHAILAECEEWRGSRHQPV